MGPLLLIFLIPIIGIFWGGFVLSILWSWFIVPLGVTPIGYVHAAGISIVLNTFMGTRGLSAELKANENKSDGEKTTESIFWATVFPALALLLGWITHNFM